VPAGNNYIFFRLQKKRQWNVRITIIKILILKIAPILNNNNNTIITTQLTIDSGI